MKYSAVKLIITISLLILSISSHATTRSWIFYPSGGYYDKTDIREKFIEWAGGQNPEFFDCWTKFENYVKGTLKVSGKIPESIAVTVIKLSPNPPCGDIRLEANPTSSSGGSSGSTTTGTPATTATTPPRPTKPKLPKQPLDPRSYVGMFKNLEELYEFNGDLTRYADSLPDDNQKLYWYSISTMLDANANSIVPK